jgi:hypothetical protein
MELLNQDMFVEFAESKRLNIVRKLHKGVGRMDAADAEGLRHVYACPWTDFFGHLVFWWPPLLTAVVIEVSR